MTTNNQTEFFTNPADVDTIMLDDEKEWVKIKKILSIGDQDRLSEMLFSVKVNTSNLEGLNRAERRRRAKADGISTDATFKPSTAALLEVSIVEWSFKDGTGVPVPLNRPMIDRLKPEWAAYIEEEIDKRDPLGKPLTPQNSETPSKDAPQPSESPTSDS